MALTEQQFANLEGNIRETFDAYFQDETDYIPMLYNVIKDETAQFTDFTVGAAGRMAPWTGSVAYDTLIKGYEKQYRAKKYSTGLQIDKNMAEDREFLAIKARIGTIANGVLATLQYDSAEIFNQAFSTDVVGPDSAALCSASHKTIPSASAQSNSGTNDISYDGMETSRLALRSLVNDRGDKMLVKGDLVIAGEYWEDTCNKLFGSDQEAFTADNTKNIYKGTKFIIHPLIEGKKWFLVNEKLMKGGAGLNWFMRQDPRKLERDGALAAGDFNTEMLSWKSVGRWDIGWTNFFWCYGNNPA